MTLPLGVICQSITPDLISTAGNHFENSSGRISWSIGECITQTYSKNGFILTQGFHQSEPGYWVYVENSETLNDLKYYPNPFNDQLTIELFNKDKSYQVSIIDCLGRTMLKLTNTKQIQTVSCPELNKGMYILKLYLDKECKTYKLIKQ